MQRWKKLWALILAGTLSLSLTGCGPAGGSGSTSAGDSASLLQFQVGEETRTLAPGDCYRSADGSTERLSIRTEESLEQLAGNLTTSGGITLGSTMVEVMDTYNLQPGYANFNYEYDPYGDGCTELADKVYDGAMVDLVEENVLDLIISFGFYREDGSWKPIDLTAHSFDDYDTCLVYAFDCEEGHDTDDPAALRAGYVFEITLTYYGD